MKFSLIAAFLLLSAASAALGQQKQLNSEKQRVATEKGLIKVSVMYPYAEGRTFDMEYCENRHMPMVAAFLGSNLVKYTIEKGRGSGIPDQPLPYLAIGTFYIRSLEDYQTAIAPNRDAIRADFVNYTNATPVIFVSEVVR